MPNAFRSRWVSAAVAVTLLACTEGDPGRSVYKESGCPRCHASDLSGTRLGPPLNRVPSDWGRRELLAFLEAPDKVRIENTRLKQIAEKYPAPMPLFLMSDSTRAQLADYLLSASR